MSADSPYSLESLERRWRVDKTPQVGLRLAEEYRRKGDLEASIKALGEGLEVYPTHTASRVALSRYLVDGARYQDAVPHLEQIISLDPTHLVANKLLVGAYAGVGRVDDARDKLAIYEMMGEGDSDIESLRRLLEAAESEPSAPSVDPAVDPAVDAVADPSADSSADSSTGGTGPGLRGGGRDETTSDPELADLFDATGPFSEDRLFGSKAEPEPASVRSAIEQEPAEAARPASAAEEPVKEPSEAPAVEPIPADEPLDAPDIGEAAGESRAALDEPFGFADPDAGPSGYWGKVADEGIFVLDTQEIEPAAAAPQPAAPASDPSPEPADPTVTLGNLYLEQGHRSEAAEVFREVLTREPENEAARSALGVADGAEVPAAPVSAADIADREAPVDAPDPLPGADESPGPNPTERKIVALRAYRSRLRRSVAAGI